MSIFTILGAVNWENEFIQSRFIKKPAHSARIVEIGDKPKLKGINNDKNVKNIL